MFLDKYKLNDFNIRFVLIKNCSNSCLNNCLGLHLNLNLWVIKRKQFLPSKLLSLRIPTKTQTHPNHKVNSCMIHRQTSLKRNCRNLKNGLKHKTLWLNLITQKQRNWIVTSLIKYEQIILKRFIMYYRTYRNQIFHQHQQKQHTFR